MSSSVFLLPKQPDFSHEKQILDKGARLVAGIDEVGRGPLAGPVVAAAVILKEDNLPQGVRDSKRLSSLQRQHIFDDIMQRATAISISVVTAADIDCSDIRTATLTAMRRALIALEPIPDFVLIDGRDIPPHLPCDAMALIKGDSRSISIACAAIVAKVVRDAMMKQAAKDYPQFGFDKHAGYGTKAHIDNLQRHKPIKNWHRFSFAPLKNKRQD